MCLEKVTLGLGSPQNLSVLLGDATFSGRWAPLYFPLGSGFGNSKKIFFFFPYKPVARKYPVFSYWV